MDRALEQMALGGEMSARKMFGEYGVYCDGTLVALFCDNQLYVKPTVRGREFIQDPVEAPAYPGAKPSFLIEEKLEDAPWLGQLIKLTAAELAAVPPKSKRKRKN